MITLYLMTEKGFAVLDEIIKVFGPAVISAVVSERDSNLGNDYYEEIKGLCQQNSISFFNRKESYPATPETRFLLAISWRWIINEPTPLIVIHDSLLPKYRGFNPLVTALINGDELIGVTALMAEAEFDTGNIIYQSSKKIKYPVKIQTAIEQIIGCYKDVATKIFKDIAAGNSLPSVPQDHSKATYSLWRDDKDYRINWSGSSAIIKRMVDAVGYPYKGAEAVIDNKIIKVLDVEEVQDMNIINREPGKVLMLQQDMPVIVCGEGLLKVVTMKTEDGNLYKLKRIRVRFE